MRGTPSAYATLLASERKPSDDTLYFISNPEDLSVTLYLGTKKIAGGEGEDLSAASIDALKDVLINSEELTDKALLVYDTEQKLWVNVSFKDAIFVGATETSSGVAGLVPAPDQNKTNLFLCSNGCWEEIPNTEITGDNLSITINGQQASLKNYNIQYYKYIPESGNIDANDYVEAHYELQIVDQEHPWQAGLEPRVVLENDELVLGWYEPNPTTIDGINNQINALQEAVKDLEETSNNLVEKIGAPADETNNIPASGIYAELNKKANLNDVYTKQETETKINEAIVGLDHLKRKEVNSIDDIDINATDADQYIYMVPSNSGDTNNAYNEYMVIEFESVDAETGETIINKQIEQVGSWQVDLADYAKKTDLFITSVDELNFQVINGKLELLPIPQEKIEGLTATLAKKVDAIEGMGLSSNDFTNELKAKLESINITGLNTVISNVEQLNKDIYGYTDENTQTTIPGLKATVSTLNTKITNLENTINVLDETYVSIANFNKVVGNLDMLLEADFNIYDEIVDINERLTWQELR